jgi:hypothetical protein
VRGNLQRNAAGQRAGAVERERPEPATRYLLLELPARAHEDRCGPGFVDRDPGAGDLRARGAPQRDQLAGALHDGDHHAVAALAGVAFRGPEHGLGAGLVDGLVTG